jgi:hypothetical protein
VSETLRVDFTSVKNTLGFNIQRPILPITFLGEQQRTLNTLVDSGADISVLPYPIGLSLGAQWIGLSDLRLSGNLADLPAKALLIEVQVGNFEPVELAFAWTRKTHIPIILGQYDFFLMFNVWFFGDAGIFEIQPRTGS